MGEYIAPPPVRRLGAEIRPVLAVRGAGTALWTGTVILVRRGWALLGAHLDGAERVGVLAFTGYAIAFSATRYPHITHFAVPGAGIAWCVAAWLVAPPAARARTATGPAPADAEEPCEPLALDTLSAVVRRVAGDRQGAHLADLLAEPELTGWEQSDLKATITALGVPVEEFKLRFSGRQRVRDGVRLRDLPPPAAPGPAPTAAPAPAPAPPLGGPPPPAPHTDQAPTPGAG
ncbi:hypothetical protein OZK63_21130 [Streptomyces sp. UMAF16]|nr:hypothetical protein [Streptomyces sp. UMAF16]